MTFGGVQDVCSWLKRLNERRCHQNSTRLIVCYMLDISADRLESADMKKGTLFFVVWGFVFASEVTTAQASHAESPSGWDYDLKLKCAKTSEPSQANYYKETQQCIGANHWSLVVQAENTPASSCIGPDNQSFLINAPSSPVTLGWIQHSSDIGSNWSVNLKVDTSAKINCQNQYTFFGFFDDIEHGGGPLPPLQKLQSSHVIAYSQYGLSGGEARLTLGAQIFWGGKAHLIEILPARIGYNANPGLPPGVIQSITIDDREYIILDNSWGVSVTPGGASEFVYVNWGGLFQKMIDLGLFTSPGTGPTATQSVYVAVEAHNRAVVDLYHTNFRVSSK